MSAGSFRLNAHVLSFKITGNSTAFFLQSLLFSQRKKSAQTCVLMSPLPIFNDVWFGRLVWEEKKKSTYICGSPSQEKYLRLLQIDGSSKALN